MSDVITIIGIIVGIIGIGVVIKPFTKFSRRIRNKIYQWRNRYHERKNHKKAQAILNKKITRAELIDVADAISEAMENITSITQLTLCILIQTISEPDNQALFNYMHRRGFNAKYDMSDIERWIELLWKAHYDGGITGEIKKLQDNIKRLNNNIEELKEELIN